MGMAVATAFADDEDLQKIVNAQGPTTIELDDILNRHAVALGEHFDSLTIIATKSGRKAGATHRHVCSHGNEYASLAALEETYLKSKPNSDDDEDEDGDKWKRTSSSIIQ